MKVKKTLLVLIVSILAFWVGLCCAENTPQSKFISGAPQFEPDKEVKGALIYRKPGLDTSSYKKVLIDPIEIWVAEDSKYKGIEPDEAKAIVDKLRETLKKALEPEYPVVDQAGEGVLGIRLAITNVHIQNKKRGLLGYTPIGLVVSTAGNLAGLRTELSQANVEAEFLDGGTHEQMAAFIDPLGDEKKEKVSWDVLGKRMETYANRIRAKLDEMAGVAAPAAE